MTVRLLLALAVGLAGCARLTARPEVAPDRYAPAAPDEAWKPTGPDGEYAIPPAERAPDRVPAPPPPPTDAPTYGLPQLIDIALANNPDTRVAWERARAAAAAYGASRSPYYPTVSAQARAGYDRSNEELPHASGVLKRWYGEPTLQLTYLLLDFGRRRADDEMFRQQLAAANFTFDRALQTVVFQTQRASSAAEQNLDLARTDDEAVERRVELGLATEPALLLSRARVAQSEFDLANARLFVREAQANVALAIGVAANAPFDVENLETQQMPASFPGAVGKPQTP
jgi:outer membrane protein TolC